MSNLLTKNFRIASAKAFQQEILNNKANIYFFMGKATPWETESSPPIPVNDPQVFSETYDNIIAAKKVNPFDVKSVVKRINWEQNTVYAEYDHLDNALYEKNFYVLNSEFNVYKCISNNNGNISTAEPKGTSLRIFTTADNYKWKFLYTIGLQDQLKFLTPLWMPVVTDDLVKSFAVDGGIENIKIINGGIDYSVRTKIEVNGDQDISANISTKVRLGTIIDYQIFDPGLRYRSGKLSLTFAGPGRFANVKPIISPIGGHGFDPIKELGTSYLMFYTKIENNEGNGIFLPDISFRQVGLINNPTFKNTLNIAANSLISFVDSLTLNNNNGTFAKNQYFSGVSSSANLYCVSANTQSYPNLVTIFYVQSADTTDNFITPNVGETILGITSGATGQVVSVNKSNFADDLGDIFYVENFSPIIRNKDQTESLHLVIEF